jgi:hypothetical protein
VEHTRGRQDAVVTRPDKAPPRVIDHLGMRIEELLLEVVQRRGIELELPLQGAVGQASAPLEHGNRVVENLLKGHRPPPYADEARRRQCGNGTGRSGVCIPHMGDKRKQEVLGARDAAVTLFSQMRGGICHVRLGRLQPRKPHTKHWSTPCP